jgi:hypothetical protein
VPVASAHEERAETEVFAAALAENGPGIAKAVVTESELVEAVLAVFHCANKVVELVFDALVALGFVFFPMNATQAEDVVGEFVLPGVKGGLGDAKLFGDLAEAFASGTQFDELVFDFSGMHREVEG